MVKNQNQPRSKGVMTRKAKAALCALIAVLMVCTSMIGGTLAYLIDKTPEIVNIFELGELNYELTFEANAPEGFSANDVTGMPETKTASIDKPEYTFNVTEKPNLKGYEFLGWAKEKTSTEPDYPWIVADGKGSSSVKVEYDEGGLYNPSTATTTKTVYAIWKQMDFKVFFDTQVDDVPDPDSQTVTYLQPYGEHAPLPKPTRTGYTFIGWTLNPISTGMDYITDVDIVETADDHTLYAQWGAKSYTIRFNANGGEGDQYTQTIKYDIPTALTQNTFTKADYTFAGWALTTDGEVTYIDKQIVTNLREEGTLDLYAVWIQDSHTLTFDYNGGTGSPDSKQVQNGKEYGTLPTYPTKHHHLFAGWYTKPEGGTRVYPSTIVNSTEDHTLYAQWIYSPANEIIQNLVIKNNPDDNFDGIVDDIYLNFMCSSYFEKFNVPLENLVIGQKYKLTFTESNDATFGANKDGYGGAIYGSIITKNGTLDKGSIKEESIADGGLIAVYDDQFDKGNAWLNGPRDWEMTFEAEATTMYWTWDMGLIQDTAPNGPARNYNFRNIRLVPVEPEIQFDDKTLLKPAAYNAKIVSQSNDTYGTTFTFDGDSGCETIYYPITGLTAGAQYTITFDHKFTGALINSQTYDYGCGIMTTKPADTAMKDKMSALGTWASTTFVHPSVTNATESVTLTFTATGDTAYWVWNMANASDSRECTVDVQVTHFSVKHAAGGSLTYYNGNARGVAVAMLAVPVLPVEFTIDLPDGITISLPDAVTVSGAGNAALGVDYLGTDCVLTLNGAEIPNILQLDINGMMYTTGLNADLVQSCADTANATAQPEWLMENEDGSQTLIIPAELMTNSAIITISGDYYDIYELSGIVLDDLT